MLLWYNFIMLSLYYATMIKVKSQRKSNAWPVIITKLFNYYRSISYFILLQIAGGLQVEKVAQIVK